MYLVFIYFLFLFFHKLILHRITVTQITAIRKETSSLFEFCPVWKNLELNFTEFQILWILKIKNYEFYF